MAVPKAEQQSGEFRVERYDSASAEQVLELVLKFEARSRTESLDPHGLGLTFRSGIDNRDLDALVGKIFEEQPELEEARRQMDEAWWARLSDETKDECEEDEEFSKELFMVREKVSRYRTVLDSPFSAELHRAQIQHHLEHTDTQHRSVVRRGDEVVGYLAVWSGPSTLYLDDHMQVDARVIDPDLTPEQQKEVAAKFQPELSDLSLP